MHYLTTPSSKPRKRQPKRKRQAYVRTPTPRSQHQSPAKSQVNVASTSLDSPITVSYRLRSQESKTSELTREVPSEAQTPLDSCEENCTCDNCRTVQRGSKEEHIAHSQFWKCQRCRRMQQGPIKEHFANCKSWVSPCCKRLFHEGSKEEHVAKL